MLLAIPTINNNLISRRFGRLTEISFLEIKNKHIIRQFSKPVSPHGHDDNDKHHQHVHHDKGNDRHDEILAKLSEADTIIFNSLCKNWLQRLSFYRMNIQRTNAETLTELIEEIEMELDKKSSLTE